MRSKFTFVLLLFFSCSLVCTAQCTQTRLQRCMELSESFNPKNRLTSLYLTLSYSILLLVVMDDYGVDELYSGNHTDSYIFLAALMKCFLYLMIRRHYFHPYSYIG